MRTVKQVSELAGVTIRTLHHYDELGLLTPSGRSEAGYRLYDHADLERLQAILVWRELHRLRATARALDLAITAAAHGHPQEETTMFDDFDHREYEDEVRERWGHTEAYRESARRTKGYGEAEWAEIRTQAETLLAEFAAAHAAGEAPGSPAARALAERHRQHMTRWFYPVSLAMHRNLAEMYIADPRFTAHYERVSPGLAADVRTAILANADAQERAAPVTPGS